MEERLGFGPPMANHYRYVEVPSPRPEFSDSPCYLYPMEEGRRMNSPFVGTKLIKTGNCKQSSVTFRNELDQTSVNSPNHNGFSKSFGRRKNNKMFGSNTPVFHPPVNFMTDVQMHSPVPVGLNVILPSFPVGPPNFPRPSQLMTGPPPAYAIQGFPFVFPPPIWTEHFTQDGKPYYYNSLTRVSTWLKPPEMTSPQNLQQILPAESSFFGNVYENTSQVEVTQTPKQTTKKRIHQEDVTNRELVCKPKAVISKPIPGTVWCLVGTSDNRVFFYNPSKGVSEWDMPLELKSRKDVYEMMTDLKKDQERIDLEMTEISISFTKEKLAVKQKVVKRAKKTKNFPFQEKSESNVEDAKSNVEEKEQEEDDSEVKVKKELSWNDISCLKDVDSVLAESLATNERAKLPLESRLQTFQELLMEKNVSAFSTWEKELQKIVFDPRYLLLTSKERKSAFQSFITKRAIEEAEENAARIKQNKTEFTEFVEKLLEENEGLGYAEFERKYAKDPKMLLFEKPKDRKLLFMECSKRIEMQNVKIYRSSSSVNNKTDRPSSSNADNYKQAEKDFTDFLKNSVHHYRCKWNDIYDKFDLRYDRRFSTISSQKMKEIFQLHCRKLKRHAQGKERGDDAKKKKHKKKSHKGSSHRKRHTKTDSTDTLKTTCNVSSQEDKSEGEISATDEM